MVDYLLEGKSHLAVIWITYRILEQSASVISNRDMERKGKSSDGFVVTAIAD